MTQSTAGPVYVVCFTFLSLAAVTVFTRLYTRLFLLKNTGPDDWIMLFALCASVAFTIVVCFQIKYGLGTPFMEIPPETLGKFFQSLWATIPMYNLALVSTKISIVFQYRRIFTQKKIQTLCHILIGILVIYGVWTVVGSFLMCMPVAYFWDKTIEGGHCMNQLAFWFTNAALNIVTDLLVFGFPMPLLKKLQLPRNQKIGLMIVFAFGGFVCITSIVRLKALYEISVATDVSLEGVSAAIWSDIEINVAIACASLPAIKPLISRIFPRLLAGTTLLRSGKTNNSTLEHGSHTLDTLNAKPYSFNDDDIKVVHSIVQEREDQVSRHGSEKSLVWKCDCYSEEQKQQHKPHQHV